MSELTSSFVLLCLLTLVEPAFAQMHYPPDGIFVSPPHYVLQAPVPPSPHQESSQDVIIHDEYDPSVIQNSLRPRPPTTTQPAHDIHDHLPLHADKRTRPIVIPGAVPVPVWKTPYSYGYFGASRTRQWAQHHGHQRTYTQWTLR